MVREPQEELKSQRLDKEAPSTPLLAGIRALGMPVAVIVAAIVGGYIANSFQGRISGTTLLSAREQAETELRASMFSSLIGPIGRAKEGDEIPPDREQLLIQLLALNFHEHFELKPLFEWAYRRRVAEGAKPEEARRPLSSIARRIIDRQIAVLRKEDNGDLSNGEGAKVYKITIVDNPRNGTEEKQLELLRERENHPDRDMLFGTVSEEIRNLTSPDKEHTLEILVDEAEADWQNGEFLVQVVMQDPREKIEDSPSFRITPFDLPFTDNTLLPDGNRFALTVLRVDTSWARIATLKLIWFPKHYYTPRERPLSHHHFLKLIGKE